WFVEFRSTPNISTSMDSWAEARRLMYFRIFMLGSHIQFLIMANRERRGVFIYTRLITAGEPLYPYISFLTHGTNHTFSRPALNGSSRKMESLFFLIREWKVSPIPGDITACRLWCD